MPQCAAAGRVHARRRDLPVLGNAGPGADRHRAYQQRTAIIPSRGGDPWATDETSLSYVDRTIKAATLRIDSRIGDLDFVSITDYQNADKFYTRRRRRLAGSWAWSSTRAATSSSTRRNCGCRATSARNHLVGGVYFMNVEGDYTGQFADPFYDGRVRARFRLHTGHHGGAGNDLVRRLPRRTSGRRRTS